MTKKNKAGQQEIIGFVVIIMLVVIVGVIFLGISIRKNKQEGISTQDAEISNFLSASAKYTSDCVFREPNYAELKDIIEGCYKGKLCSDERNSCDILKAVYSEMISRLWAAGKDRPIKYAGLGIYYQADTENPDTKKLLIEKIESGEENESCGIRRAGKYSQYEYPGNLIVELEVCSG